VHGNYNFWYFPGEVEKFAKIAFSIPTNLNIQLWCLDAPNYDCNESRILKRELTIDEESLSSAVKLFIERVDEKSVSHFHH